MEVTGQDSRNELNRGQPFGVHEVESMSIEVPGEAFSSEGSNEDFK